MSKDSQQPEKTQKSQAVKQTVDSTKEAATRCAVKQEAPKTKQPVTEEQPARSRWPETPAAQLEADKQPNPQLEMTEAQKTLMRKSRMNSLRIKGRNH